MDTPVKSWRSAAWLTVLSLFVSAAQAAELPAYRLEVVRGDGTYYPTIIDAINNRGQLVGRARHLEPRPDHSALVLITDGEPRVLSESENTGEHFRDLNEAGDVLGAGRHHPIVWRRDGTIERVPMLQQARGINSAGQIAGEFKGSPARFDHGALTLLETVDGEYAAAEAINEQGVIAGGAYRTVDGISYREPAIWDENGRIKLLGSFGTVGGTALAINDLGHTVGYSIGRHPDGDAFFHDGSQMVAVPRAEGSCRVQLAVAINNHDLVVAHTECGGGMGPVLWQGGATRHLRDLLPDRAKGWKTMFAKGVNDAGQVVGWGLYYGKERSFIASPVAAR
jgi:uncharacterized membrane protein